MYKPVHDLPPLNGLRVFEVAARHLSFRSAAEELGVTQSAVAQQIRGLEAALGVRLFERHPRTLVLTDAGRGYAANIRRAFELIVDATRMLAPGGARVTISVTPSVASRWLIPRLPDFTRSHPDIELRIVATDRISNFHADAVDMAVRYGRPPFGAGLSAELLFAGEIVAVASPLLVERLGRPETAADCARYPLLHDAHNAWPQFLERGAAGTPAASARNIRFNQTALAIEAAIAGQGLALASAFLVEDDIAAGRLVRVLQASLHVGADFYIVRPRRPARDGSLAAVARWLAGQASRPRV